MSNVYFISAPSLRLVKIGTSNSPQKRLQEIQVGSACPVFLAAVVDGGAAVEQSLHSRFAHLRSHGEWFSLAGELAEFIATLSPWEPPEPMKRGRPATGRKRASNLDVPMTSEERETLQAAADRVGLPLSRWLRELGLKHALQSQR